jgi:hypothetical protein
MRHCCRLYFASTTHTFTLNTTEYEIENRDLTALPNKDEKALNMPSYPKSANFRDVMRAQQVSALTRRNVLDVDVVRSYKGICRTAPRTRLHCKHAQMHAL